MSVIIPAYNEEALIRHCLISILNQNLPSHQYEVIVVDNKSTDSTARIVLSEFPRVRLVKENRQGVVFARIKGINESRGEIVAFIDADSHAPKGWLKNILNVFIDTEAVAVGSIIDFIPKSRLINLTQPILNKVGQTFKIPTGCNIAFRKSAYYQIGGFSEKVNLNEDFRLSLKLKRAGKVVFLENNPVVTSSRRFQSTSKLIPYATKVAVNYMSIGLFDKSIFFNFETIRELSSEKQKLLSMLIKKLPNL